jgi:hypothetical protein
MKLCVKNKKIRMWRADEVKIHILFLWSQLMNRCIHTIDVWCNKISCSYLKVLFESLLYLTNVLNTANVPFSE